MAGLIPRGEVPPGEEPMFLKVVCPPNEGDNAVPDPLPPPDRIFSRVLDVMLDLPLPPNVAARVGADKLNLWVIADDADPAGRIETFPSPTIRTVEDEVINVFTQMNINQHTIHWHGIEPTTMHDGVGHTSMEPTQQWPYQFATRVPGTFIYHCHVNTTLHFEMGLYGLLIVDPRNANPTLFPGMTPPFADGGPGLYSADLADFPAIPNADRTNFLVRYDAEALWAIDSMQASWHNVFNQHAQFQQQCDQQDPANPATFERGVFHDFRPDVFLVTGIVSETETADGPQLGIPITNAPVALTLRVGQAGLIRLVDADYLFNETLIAHDVILVGADGYPFGRRGPAGAGPNRFSSPFRIKANTPIRTTSARRYDLLIHATTVGEFPVTFRFHDWIRNPNVTGVGGRSNLLHTARTVIRVVP